LDQVPVTWTNVKKKALVTKEKHSKEQSVQVRRAPRIDINTHRRKQLELHGPLS